MSLRFIFIVGLILTLFFSGCESTLNEKKLDSELKSMFHTKYINLDLTIISQSSKSIDVKLLFHEPYISHNDQQEVLIAYFINESELLKKFDDINVRFSIDKESDKFVREVVYDKQKIENLNKGFSVQLNKELILYCLDNFAETDIYHLNKGIEVYNMKYPEKSFNDGFFGLITKYTSNCNENLDNERIEDILGALYLMFSYADDSLSHLKGHINKVWESCNGTKLIYNDKENRVDIVPQLESE